MSLAKDPARSAEVHASLRWQRDLVLAVTRCVRHVMPHAPFVRVAEMMTPVLAVMPDVGPEDALTVVRLLDDLAKKPGSAANVAWVRDAYAAVYETANLPLALYGRLRRRVEELDGAVRRMCAQGPDPRGDARHETIQRVTAGARWMPKTLTGGF